jgi:hypothetical protein
MSYIIIGKHDKYKTAYKPNDVYWGLGVEHETYLETSKLKKITLKELKENRQRERYCVDYYNVYDPIVLNHALDGLFEPDKEILIPILVNSHTFQKTDINGEHITTFERIPKANTKFNGKTIFQWMREENPDVFNTDYDKSYIFDGDTIEFITQRFYKASISSVIEELTTIERDFMRALNSLPREGILKLYAPFQIAKKNYPFASYITNLKNNAMFNNGTIHINITLPTRLNESAQIADFEAFKSKHQNLARILQWISPLLVAVYGAYDPLCESKTNGDKFAAGSQRVAVSRYIGLGTYDTDKMEQGKILTRDKSQIENLTWYEEFHKHVSFKYLDELGMDINFNKHFAHGIEFRILDALPISDLEEILKLVVYLSDFSLENTVCNPTKTSLWNKLAFNCVHNGKGYYIDVPDQHELLKVFKIDHSSKEPLPASEILNILTNHLKIKYKDGLCTRLMIKEDISALPTATPTPLPISDLFIINLSALNNEELTISRDKSYSVDSLESTDSVKPVPFNTPQSELIVSSSTLPVKIEPSDATPVTKIVKEVPKKKFTWCC